MLLGTADDDPASCPSDTVDVMGGGNFVSTDGPRRFSVYTVFIIAVNLVATLLFVQFLPPQKEQCHAWRKKVCQVAFLRIMLIHIKMDSCYVQGEIAGRGQYVGYAAVTIAAVIVLYGIIISILLMDNSTACLGAVGGTGCNNS
jgi:preprotein translocase subunit SecG